MNYAFHDLARKAALLFKWTLVPAAAAAISAPASAQYPPPGSVPPPRSIIISRDVPQRPAFDPGQPGTVTTVDTAPVETIFGATDQMVSILSDDQTAGITSGSEIPAGAVTAAMQSANAALNPQLGTDTVGQTAANSMGGGLGGTITSAIGTATGAIGSALAPLSAKRD